MRSATSWARRVVSSPRLLWAAVFGALGAGFMASPKAVSLVGADEVALGELAFGAGEGADARGHHHAHAS